MIVPVYSSIRYLLRRFSKTPENPLFRIDISFNSEDKTKKVTFMCQTREFMVFATTVVVVEFFSSGAIHFEKNI